MRLFAQIQTAGKIPNIHQGYGEALIHLVYMALLCHMLARILRWQASDALLCTLLLF